MGIRLRDIVVGSGLALGFSCVHVTEIHPVDAFTVDPLKENVQQKLTRLGNTTKCEELIPFHNDIRKKDRLNVTFVLVNYGKDEVMDVALKALDYHQLHSGLLTDETIASNASSFNFWVRKNPITVKITDELENEDGTKKKNRYSAEVRTEDNEKFGYECGGEERNLIFFLTNRNFVSTARYPDWYRIEWDKLVVDNFGTYRNKYSDLSTTDCRVRYSMCEDYGREDDLCLALDEVAGVTHNESNKKLCPLITGDLEFNSSIVAHDSIGSMSHEFHHLFEGAQDLYESETVFAEHIEQFGSQEKYLDHLRKIAIDCYPAESRRECKDSAPWRAINSKETGCYKGCEYAQEVAGVPVWRPHKETMMRDSDVKDLGWWGEYRFCLALELYTGDAHGICQDYGYGLEYPTYERQKNRKRAKAIMEFPDNWL